MTTLSEKELAAWEKKRGLNAELLRALDEMKQSRGARKTEFFTRPDGSIRRFVTRALNPGLGRVILPSALDPESRGCSSEESYYQSKRNRRLKLSIKETK
jgi:hypothetical protein